LIIISHISKIVNIGYFGIFGNLKYIVFLGMISRYFYIKYAEIAPLDFARGRQGAMVSPPPAGGVPPEAA
jgi:hypothetical protein